MTSNISQNDWTLTHLAAKDTCLESLKRSNFRHRHLIRLPENTLELSVQGLITACPGAQQGRLLARHRRAESCFVRVLLVPLERRSRHQQPQPGLLLPGMLVFFVSSGCRVATAARARIHSASPDQTSALFMLVTVASVCSRDSDARHRWSQKNTSSLVNCWFRSPRKGSSASTFGQTSEGKDMVNLLTDGHPGPAEP